VARWMGTTVFAQLGLSTLTKFDVVRQLPCNGDCGTDRNDRVVAVRDEQIMELERWWLLTR
jgi:hypothetical protein